MGRSEPERTCIVTREAGSPEGLIRFVVAPDGTVVADLRRKLPGRGAWVTARADVVRQAVRARLFARAFKAEVKVPPRLADEIDAALARRQRPRRHSARPSRPPGRHGASSSRRRPISCGHARSSAEPCSARTAASATASASRDGASSRPGLWYPYRSFHSYSCGPAVRIWCRLKGRIPGLTGLRRELGRVGFRAAIGPQPAPTRDESVAARARGDGSMYHI